MKPVRLAALLLVLALPARGASTPDWLTGALGTISPPASDSAHAHVLFEETHVVLPNSGRVRTTSRGVVRVLDKRGGSDLAVRVPYDRASAEVREFRTWLLLPDGSSRTSGPRDALDVASASWGELASEMRARVYEPPPAPPGAVFAWEWTVEEDVLDCEWWEVFGRDDPVARQRLVIELPAGIEPVVRAWGARVPVAVREGQRWIWEARDLLAARDEPWSPNGAVTLDHVVVSARRAGDGPAPPGVVFTDWASVARWHAGLDAPSAQSTPELDELASTLTRGHSGVVERARAIGQRVQKVNYVSVALGLAHGGGYVPRPAGTVLRTNAGDCKDKANLFCTLARSAGLEAWMVSVRTRGRDRVHDDWPSPHQFDHAIAAVRVPKGTALPAVSDSTPLGTLLFFDPTDPLTPFGTLPEHEQGTYALLQDAERGALVRLPATPPEQVRTVWRVDATLDSTGALHGEWHARLRGGRATEERARRALGEAEYRRGFESALADWIGAVRIERAVSADAPDDDAFTFEVTFTAERFGRRLSGDLLSFRSAPLSSRDRWTFTDTTRRTPVALPAYAFAETVSIRLPAGWHAEALPARLASRKDFGDFDASWVVEDGRLRFTYVSTTQPVTLPVTRYREVREWWTARNRPFQTHVVLQQGPPH